jgi:hypothetical protein
LFAALTALAAYRILESGLGLASSEIFAFGIGGAVAMTAILGLTHLVRSPREG